MLNTLLGNISGVAKVYYQPPESVKLVYPCIIYEIDDDKVVHADNKKYTIWDRYLVTVIDKKPDSEIFKMVRELPYCDFVRSYKKDNLNHFVFELYYK